MEYWHRWGGEDSSVKLLLAWEASGKGDIKPRCPSILSSLFAMLWFLLIVGASAQIQVPHGRVPTPGLAPPTQNKKSANFYLAPNYIDSYYPSVNNYHTAAGYPGFYSHYGLSPQQNGDGSWNFVTHISSVYDPEMRRRFAWHCARRYGQRPRLSLSRHYYASQITLHRFLVSFNSQIPNLLQFIDRQRALDTPKGTNH